MAIVLDAFASYLKDLLEQAAKDEVGMLLGVSSNIDKMGAKLGDLKNFLADADRRRITDQSVQGWVRELKGAMYDATDILDLCQLKTMERGPSAVDLSCFNSLLFCLRNPLFAHDIGSRIKALNQKLDSIKERSAAFSFVNLSSYEDLNNGVHSSQLSTSRETTGAPARSGVVGEKIEEDTRKLVEMLIAKEGNSNIMVVAIVGVGGIGKTTLAREVFNHDTIKNKFDKMIWLSVNQDFDKAELLRTAITQGGGDHRGEKATAVLGPTLTAALSGKRVLLVMDDVWNEKAWEGVLETPLLNAAAPVNRVIVTTRDVRVARGMKAEHPYHHVDKLGTEDAWSLLKKQVVSSEIDETWIDDTLKDIGLQIIAKCGGLPLAVKVMGGLLCKRDKRRADWEKVLNDSIWSVSEMPPELNYAIYLSYEDLPPCLKQCFLHYSLLPQNTEFSDDRIVSMWIGEGFLHGNSEDLEELGSEWYKELILRNLIEPDPEYADQWFCKMHDVVRSFAQYVARDEALVAQNGETNIISKLSSRKILRLSLESKGLESDEFEWSFLQAQTSLRTLISIGHMKIKPGDSLITLSSLRTLHIESANFATLVQSLYQLKHLRYLALRQTDVSRLPENISKMRFVQHINLYGCKSLVKLPDSIVRLGQLRFLNIAGTSINSTPRGFRCLTNLRKLYGFPAHMDGDWCSLEDLGPLLHLRILHLNNLENVSAASSATKARLGEKVHLTYLSLCSSSRVGDDGLVKEEEQQRIEGVFDELCPLPCLDYLEIEGYFGRRLPGWMMSTAAAPLKSLRILIMKDLACCIQLPDSLCQLPCLQLLQIDHTPAIKRIGAEFLQLCYHHSHHPSSQTVVGFPRLQRMRLRGMVEWEEWEWEPEPEQVNMQAMPVLELLHLERCKLWRIPPGLASHARALKRLCIYEVQHLNSLENFASVVELEVRQNPDLERITNLPKLQNLVIVICPKFKVLEGVPALQRLKLVDYNMETLSEFMLDVKPRHLLLDCSLELLVSIAAGRFGPEWGKFRHIEHVKAYASDGDNQRKWYVRYTRDPSCNLETNIINGSPRSAGDEEE